MGMDGGGGKLHHDANLVKSLSRVEPRKFGVGLVVGFLLVTCAYFSTAKFDAIYIAMGKRPTVCIGCLVTPSFSCSFPSLIVPSNLCAVSPSGENAAGIGSLVKAADGSKHQLGEPSIPEILPPSTGNKTAR
jgi:hypothetical protein